MESKLLQGPLQELLIHAIISLLHVQLDRHEVVASGGTVEIVYKLLSNKNIIGDTMATDECPLLLRANLPRKDQLHPTHHQLSIDIVQNLHK